MGRENKRIRTTNLAIATRKFGSTTKNKIIRGKNLTIRTEFE